MNLIIEAFQKGYRVIDGNVYLNKEKIKTFYNSKKYKTFFLENNKPTFVQVHRLLGYQKFGKKMFQKGIQIRHKDNNKSNNFDDNILIGTQSDNMMDIPKEIRKKKAINASKKIRKFSNEDVEIIKNDYSKSKSYKKIMSKWNISSKGTLYNILNRKYVT